MKTKITIFLTIFCLTFGFTNLKAEAQLGDLLGSIAGNIFGSGVQNVRIISDASESAITTAIKTTLSSITGGQTADAIEQLLFKEQVLDPAAWGMAKQMQQQLTGELLKWLGGQQPGQDGQIPFVQNYSEYYQNINDQVAGDFIFSEGLDTSGQSDPEKAHRVRTALYNGYLSQREKGVNGGVLQSTEGDTNQYKSISHRLLGDFVNCRDDMCAVYEGQNTLNRRQANAIQNERDLISNTRGMLPQRVCTDVETANGGNRTDCRIVNPPSLAADMVSFNLVELPGLQMLNMDEFNEIASNLMNNLANQALQGLTGVLGLTGNPIYSQSIFGPDGALSYVEALITDNITQYQVNNSNVIKEALAIEQEYLQLQQHILNEVSALQTKLDQNKEEFSPCFDMELTDELKKARENGLAGTSVASTTISILTTLDTQYSSSDATTKNAALVSYNAYKTQGLFQTAYKNQELKISYIDLEFSQMVDRFKYDTAISKQNCGGEFDYDGILLSQ